MNLCFKGNDDKSAIIATFEEFVSKRSFSLYLATTRQQTDCLWDSLPRKWQNDPDIACSALAASLSPRKVSDVFQDVAEGVAEKARQCLIDLFTGLRRGWSEHWYDSEYKIHDFLGFLRKGLENTRWEYDPDIASAALRLLLTKTQLPKKVQQAPPVSFPALNNRILSFSELPESVRTQENLSTMEAFRWVFDEEWSDASSWLCGVSMKDGEGLLQDWWKRKVCGRETLEQVSAPLRNDTTTQLGQDAKTHTPSNSFRAGTWNFRTGTWMNASPTATVANLASPMPFDPFGHHEFPGQTDDKVVELEAEDEFMIDPVVDVSGVTIDRFFLHEVDVSNGIEYYPNRAVKLYYQRGPQDHIPECFLCPIGLEIMDDPVILPDGHSFDRAALTTWLDVNNTSPATRQVVSKDDVRPNWMLRKLIRQYRCNEFFNDREEFWVFSPGNPFLEVSARSPRRCPNRKKKKKNEPETCIRFPRQNEKP